MIQKTFQMVSVLSAGLIALAPTQINSSGSGITQAAGDVRYARAPVYNVRDYGATGNGSTDDTTALQAAINAADAAPSGTVYIPNGSYKITGLIVGTGNTSGNGAVSNVSIVGESELQTQLKYYGSSNGIALQLNRNKYARMERFRLSNLTGSRSTTEGIQTSGPSANGTESNGHVWRQLIVEGFHYGWHTSAGTGATGSTSSEFTLTNCDFSNCDAGIRSFNFNALNINLINCAFSGNTTGVDDYTSGVFVYGGAGSGNGIDFQFNSGGTQAINNFRSEGSAQFINGVAGTAGFNIFVSNCLTSGMTLTGSYGAAMYFSGRIEINSCVIDGPIRVSNGAGAYAGDISIVNCKVKDTRPFYRGGSDGAGMHYRIRGVGTYSSDVNSPTEFPNSEGVITSSAYADWVNEPTDGAGATLSPLKLDGTTLSMPNVPTADPHVVGRVWNNSGVLTISAG